MRIAVLGTGMVGQAVGGKLDELGHQVTFGTRDVDVTLARTEPNAWGYPAFAVWKANHPQVGLATFAEAAAQAELVVNATQGQASLPALEAAGAENLAGKILIDIANPLDFSRGMPPSLFVKDDDSLGEQIQRAFPQARVVKTLNTLNADLMVDPGKLADADHTIFLAGDDADAKAQVGELLRSFGWRDIIDLGDITGARVTEMFVPLWVRLMTTLGTPSFNVKIIH